MSTTVLATVLAAFLLGVFGENALAQWGLSQACPEPAPGLQHGQKNVDDETAVVSEEGDRSQLDIFSGFAPQYGSASSNYCARYEVENEGPSDIKKLWWPIVPMDIATLRPTDRQSVITTLPPGDAPVVKATKLYAFKSQIIPSRAYQSAAAAKSDATVAFLIADTSSADRLLSAPPITVLQMGERTSLPEVGAEFNGSGTTVGATSTVTREGSFYTFKLVFGWHGKIIKGVLAPFASALEQNTHPELLPTIIGEYRAKPISLPLGENTHVSTAKFTLDGGELAPIYVVSQQIVVLYPGGSVCFQAPTYSPTPISDNILSCR